VSGVEGDVEVGEGLGGGSGCGGRLGVVVVVGEDGY
jgi:hypothetical protein